MRGGEKGMTWWGGKKGRDGGGKVEWQRLGIGGGRQERLKRVRDDGGSRG